MNMNRSCKIRIAVFSAVLMLLLICSAMYASELFGMMYGKDRLFGASDLYVDGADLGAVTDLVATGMNSLAGMFSMIIDIVTVTVGCTVFFAVLRLVMHKKAAEVTKDEYRICARINIICTSAVFIVSVLSTGIFFAPYALLLFWQPPLFAYLLYLRLLRSKLPKDDDDIE